MNVFCRTVMLILLFTGIAQAQTITFVCENKQDVPTIMGNTTEVEDQKPGMGVEAVRMLEKELGMTIVLKRLPWKRCMKELADGKADGLFTASYKEKRKKYGKYPEKDGQVDVSRRYSSSSYAFYRLKSSPLDFTGKNYGVFTGKIGGPRGYSIIDDLKAKGLKMDESPSTEIDFKKLMGKRLQAVAAIESNGDYFLTKNSEFSENIEKMKPLIVEKPYYFMLSHQFYDKNPGMAEKIFDTIAEIRENAEYQNKLADYL
ncbi:MAG: transporter substrate-binding domain-containing protein [Desulfobacterium sp.]|nr:transporter substrate-binding domain-containing protein [Desulfobacterium sp.]